MSAPDCPNCRPVYEKAILEGKAGYVMCSDCVKRQRQECGTLGDWTQIGTNPETRRLAVPGGWLYQVEHEVWVPHDDSGEGSWQPVWHPPVFVPREP